MGDLRPSSTRRLDLRSVSDARGTKAVFTAHENAPAGLHEREAKGDVCCLRHRYELVRNLYKLKPPPVRCMTFSCLFVHRAGGFRVRRAGRARQGATDAPRRTRRSLKSERGASAADRRRRFDMPGRFSWSRVAHFRRASARGSIRVRIGTSRIELGRGAFAAPQPTTLPVTYCNM